MTRRLRLVALSLWVFTTLSFAKVYDCFMFFNEYEVLDLRFHELYDYVDHFVIVESCEGFTGNPKEFNFEAHKERYAPFLDKVIYIKLTEPQIVNCAWEREYWQRNQIMRGLVDCEDDDVVFISDCDEIIEGSHVQEAVEALKEHTLVAFRPKIWSWYCFNRVLYSPNCTDAISTSELKKIESFMEDNTQRGLGVCCSTVGLCYQHLKPFSPQILRENVRSFQSDGTACDHPYPVTYYKVSGWHFSSAGGFEAAFQKMQNWAHYGDAIGVHNEIKPGSDEYKYLQWRKKVDGYKLDIIDETYPQYVQDNMDHFINIGIVDAY